MRDRAERVGACVPAGTAGNRRSTWPAVIVAALVLAACSSGESPPEPSTAPDPTARSTTTAPVPEPDNAFGEEPNIITVGAEPSGSGCSPGTDALPDGWWYGEIVAAADGSVIEFDLACIHHDAEAYLEHGHAYSYVVVNENPRLRPLAVSTRARARCVERRSTRPCEIAEVDGGYRVWIRVTNGAVDRLEEYFDRADNDRAIAGTVSTDDGRTYVAVSHTCGFGDPGPLTSEYALVGPSGPATRLVIPAGDGFGEEFGFELLEEGSDVPLEIGAATVTGVTGEYSFGRGTLDSGASVEFELVGVYTCFAG